MYNRVSDTIQVTKTQTVHDEVAQIGLDQQNFEQNRDLRNLLVRVAK